MKKCRFFTKCCFIGIASGFIVISALLVGGFFTLKKFNEMTYEVERLSLRNEWLSRELYPTELMFFISTEKMNWFEANRVIVQIFLFEYVFLFISDSYQNTECPVLSCPVFCLYSSSLYINICIYMPLSPHPHSIF